MRRAEGWPPRFPWGDEEPDDQTVFANIWQGQFPHTNLLTDGYMGTSPAKAFPANARSVVGGVFVKLLFDAS